MSMSPNAVSVVHVPAFDAVASIVAATSSAVKAGFAAQTSAASPATSGAAYDVPLPIAELPGASTSTYVPVLENDARAPVRVAAPTTSPASPRSAAGYTGRSP